MPLAGIARLVAEAAIRGNFLAMKNLVPGLNGMDVDVVTQQTMSWAEHDLAHALTGVPAEQMVQETKAAVQQWAFGTDGILAELDGPEVLEAGSLLIADAPMLVVIAV